jgi:hypothetical protein
MESMRSATAQSTWAEQFLVELLARKKHEYGKRGNWTFLACDFCAPYPAFLRLVLNPQDASTQHKVGSTFLIGYFFPLCCLGALFHNSFMLPFCCIERDGPMRRTDLWDVRCGHEEQNRFSSCAASVRRKSLDSICSSVRY